jgi:hypothetical protein
MNPPTGKKAVLGITLVLGVLRVWGGFRGLGSYSLSNELDSNN